MVSLVLSIGGGIFGLIWRRVGRRPRNILFFGRRRPDLALIEVVPFFGSIVLMAVTVAPLDRRAAWAFVPYLLWVMFATVLNIAIVRRNAPFGTR